MHRRCESSMKFYRAIKLRKKSLAAKNLGAGGLSSRQQDKSCVSCMYPQRGA